MDLNNPATVKLTTIPPAMLEELDKDPAALQPMARKMFYTQLAFLHQLMRSPNVPIGQRIQALDIFAKAADAYPKANANAQVAQGSGFSVKIVLNNNPTPNQQLETVELVQDVAPQVAGAANND